MDTVLEVESGEAEVAGTVAEVESGEAGEVAEAEVVRGEAAAAEVVRGEAAAAEVVEVSDDEGEVAAEPLLDPPSPPASPVEAGGVGVAEPPRPPASPAPTELDAPSSDEGAEGDVEAGGAGDGPASLGHLAAPDAPGSRIVDWFLQNRWGEVMPRADPAALLDYGIQLTAVEVARGLPWDLRPWPPPILPPLRPERIFGPFGGVVAGGDRVLPNGQVLWLNPAGPMPNAPGPSAASRALVGWRPRLASVGSWEPRRVCPSCGLRTCFCLSAVELPSGGAMRARARPMAGTRCYDTFFLCECPFGVCGGRA